MKRHLKGKKGDHDQASHGGGAGSGDSALTEDQVKVVKQQAASLSMPGMHFTTKEQVHFNMKTSGWSNNSKARKAFGDDGNVEFADAVTDEWLKDHPEQKDLLDRSGKKPTVKSWKQDTVPVNKMIMRMVNVRRETADEENKSVEVVIASEHPVERWDEENEQVVREILDMDGVQFRGKKNQLPIVDSHDRSTIRNVNGSIRNIRVEGTELVGDATFARDQASQDAYHKVLDGHLTDFSITATPNKVRSIRRGESELHRGEDVQGPADIVRSWTPTDASLVAAGADETSTVRELLRAYQIPIARGESVADEELEVEEIEEEVDETEPEGEEETTETIEKEDEEMSEEKKQEVVDRALKADRERRREIVALGTKFNIERDEVDKWCDDPKTTVQAVKEHVIERGIVKPLGTSTTEVKVTKDGEESFNRAMRDGLLTRALKRVTKSDPWANEKRADGYQDFERMPLLRMATTLLERGGINTMRLSDGDIAMVALGARGTINRLASAGLIQRDAAYHTTGTFSNLLLDAMNKTLSTGYAEAQFTYSMWAEVGESTNDLKELHAIRFSEAPDLEDIPENNPYPEGIMGDEKESYKPIKRGRVMTVSWETIVNDDMGALSRVPAMQGIAARRTINKKVYAELTNNANMSDGNALFSAAHGNLDATVTTAPTVAALNQAYIQFMTQTNIKGQIIGVAPRYIIVPPALSGTTLELLGSTSNPASGGANAGNANVTNIYGPNGGRVLTPVIEPQLNANSATAWYMAADSMEVQTVQIRFLAGEESPVLESEFDFDHDFWKYKVRQTFGVKAVDWRGLYKNPGV